MCPGTPCGARISSKVLNLHFGTLVAQGRGMAHPRRVVAGETYLLTRRCYQRTFRLRPCAETNRIFLYCLAFAAQRTGVVIHAACVMSNHHHLVVTDTCGVLSEFLRELHRLTAKAINASQGQWENLWAAEPCNAVRLVTEADVEDKIAYVVANPVAAGLVEQPEHWPGVLLWGDRSIRVARPEVYFRESGTCPPELELRIQRPGPMDGGADSTLREAGRGFLGRAAVLASSFAQRARAYEERFGVIPTFAAKLRAVREALRRVARSFRRQYRQAFERWRRGERDVAFPVGTWGMVVVHGAVVGAAAAFSN